MTALRPCTVDLLQFCPAAPRLRTARFATLPRRSGFAHSGFHDLGALKALRIQGTRSSQGCNASPVSGRDQVENKATNAQNSKQLRAPGDSRVRDVEVESDFEAPPKGMQQCSKGSGPAGLRAAIVKLASYVLKKPTPKSLRHEGERHAENCPDHQAVISSSTWTATDILPAKLFGCRQAPALLQTSKHQIWKPKGL